MSEKRSIPVRILGQEYRVRSEAAEDTVRGAATLVDETMQRIRQRTGTVDTRDLAVLAALNLANRVVSAGRTPVAVQDASGDGRLQTLIERVESEIENDAAAL